MSPLLSFAADAALRLSGAFLGAGLAILVEVLCCSNIAPPGRRYYVRVFLWGLGFSTLFATVCPLAFVSSALTSFSTVITLTITDRLSARSKRGAS